GLEQNRRGRPRANYISKSPLDLGWQSNAEVDYVQASFGTGDDETWGPKKVDGFVHTRRVLFVKPDCWVVIDTGTPNDGAEHLYESCFYLDAADAHVDDATKSVTTTDSDKANVAIVPIASGDFDVRVVKGQSEPEMLGWIATSAYQMKAVPTVYYSCRAK